jgi:predicted dehydrogenase
MSRTRYALIGTGARATLYLNALADTYHDTAELVALCDLSQTRMDWHNRQLAQHYDQPPRPTYPAAHFDRMIAETRPDVVIVTTMDSTHHQYITRAMELGCDVITEKPLTTDLDRLGHIFDAIARTGRSLRVTFNYRYAPAMSRFREIIAQGRIGRPLAVDFSWLLDTRHGADYFRRWHREKHHSGGLLVHKATHHFDLVNWWLGSFPAQVMAMGDLMFYGQANAQARGESYSYQRYTGVAAAADDPFALRLDEDDFLRGLYLDAEAETGYLRDRNVFGAPITIEDTMSVSVRYRSGAILSYSLIAYSPWEGLRVAVTGTKGRLELDVVESINHLRGGQADQGASKGPYKLTQMRLYPLWGTVEAIEIPTAAGGHGGADPAMLIDLFAPDPPPDPLRRAATHIDGAASILVGICANESMRTGQRVAIDDLFPLPTQES